MKNEDGTITQYTAKIKPCLTHEQSLAKYEGKASFEITEMSFQCSVGTYLDSPYHRYQEKRDISELQLEEMILPGILIDVREKEAYEAVGIDVIEKGTDLRGKAILFNFGWDVYWGTDKYYSYPYISEDLINYLFAEGVKLVGVDTVNIDSIKDPCRPAHSLFLENDILIVENLTDLSKLKEKEFIFYAIPLKAKRTAVMPVRAFAEIV
jgi:kynurenine formamidase